MAGSYPTMGLARSSTSPPDWRSVRFLACAHLPLDFNRKNRVGRAFRTKLREVADKPDPHSYDALLEFVDIDVHVPVLDLPEYGTRSTSAKVSRAAIQGSFQLARRDYVNVFRDLIAELECESYLHAFLDFQEMNLCDF